MVECVDALLKEALPRHLLPGFTEVVCDPALRPKLQLIVKDISGELDLHEFFHSHLKDVLVSEGFHRDIIAGSMKNEFKMLDKFLPKWMVNESKEPKEPKEPKEAKEPPTDTAKGVASLGKSLYRRSKSGLGQTLQEFASNL